MTQCDDGCNAQWFMGQTKRSAYHNNGKNVWVIHGKIDVNRCNYNDVVPLCSPHTNTHTNRSYLRLRCDARPQHWPAANIFWSYVIIGITINFHHFAIGHWPSSIDRPTILTQIGYAPSAMAARPLCATNSLHRYGIISGRWRGIKWVFVDEASAFIFRARINNRTMLVLITHYRHRHCYARRRTCIFGEWVAVAKLLAINRLEIPFHMKPINNNCFIYFSLFFIGDSAPNSSHLSLGNGYDAYDPPTTTSFIKHKTIRRRPNANTQKKRNLLKIHCTRPSKDWNRQTTFALCPVIMMIGDGSGLSVCTLWTLPFSVKRSMVALWMAKKKKNGDAGEGCDGLGRGRWNVNFLFSFSKTIPTIDSRCRGHNRSIFVNRRLHVFI